MDQIGKTIREERKRTGLRQKELGEYAGVGINFISQLEQGKESVRFDKLLEVLKVLGLELELKRGKKLISISNDLVSKK